MCIWQWTRYQQTGLRQKKKFVCLVTWLSLLKSTNPKLLGNNLQNIYGRLSCQVPKIFMQNVILSLKSLTVMHFMNLLVVFLFRSFIDIHCSSSTIFPHCKLLPSSLSLISFIVVFVGYWRWKYFWITQSTLSWMYLECICSLFLIKTSKIGP